MSKKTKRDQSIGTRDLHIGDRVRIRGFSGLEGVVIESQGHIGVGGRQIVRVSIDIPAEKGGPMETSATPDDVEVLAPAKAA